MERTTSYPTTPALSMPQKLSHAFLQSLAGSAFIALCSLIWIPTLPIPVTMQTFALAILAFVQPPRIAFSSAVLYLFEATIGLPVLCGYTNMLWFCRPTTGYLASFPFACYVMASLTTKESPVLRQLFALATGQLMILTAGSIWLSCFIGVKEAFFSGFFFFIPSTAIKIGLAMACARAMTISHKNHQ